MPFQNDCCQRVLEHIGGKLYEQKKVAGKPTFKVEGADIKIDLQDALQGKADETDKEIEWKNLVDIDKASRKPAELMREGSTATLACGQSQGNFEKEFLPLLDKKKAYVLLTGQVQGSGHFQVILYDENERVWKVKGSVSDKGNYNLTTPDGGMTPKAVEMLINSKATWGNLAGNRYFALTEVDAPRYQNIKQFYQDFRSKSEALLRERYPLRPGEDSETANQRALASMSDDEKLIHENSCYTYARSFSTLRQNTARLESIGEQMGRLERELAQEVTPERGEQIRLEIGRIAQVVRGVDFEIRNGEVDVTQRSDRAEPGAYVKAFESVSRQLNQLLASKSRGEFRDPKLGAIDGLATQLRKIYEESETLRLGITQGKIDARAGNAKLAELKGKLNGIRAQAVGLDLSKSQQNSESTLRFLQEFRAITNDIEAVDKELKVKPLVSSSKLDPTDKQEIKKCQEKLVQLQQSAIAIRREAGAGRASKADLTSRVLEIEKEIKETSDLVLQICRAKNETYARNRSSEVDSFLSTNECTRAVIGAATRSVSILPDFAAAAVHRAPDAVPPREERRDPRPAAPAAGRVDDATAVVQRELGEISGIFARQESQTNGKVLATLNSRITRLNEYCELTKATRGNLFFKLRDAIEEAQLAFAVSQDSSPPQPKPVVQPATARPKGPAVVAAVPKASPGPTVAAVPVLSNLDVLKALTTELDAIHDASKRLRFVIDSKESKPLLANLKRAEQTLLLYGKQVTEIVERKAALELSQSEMTGFEFQQYTQEEAQTNGSLSLTSRRLAERMDALSPARKAAAVSEDPALSQLPALTSEIREMVKLNAALQAAIVNKREDVRVMRDELVNRYVTLSKETRALLSSFPNGLPEHSDAVSEFNRASLEINNILDGLAKADKYLRSLEAEVAAVRRDDPRLSGVSGARPAERPAPVAAGVDGRAVFFLGQLQQFRALQEKCENLARATTSSNPNVEELRKEHSALNQVFQILKTNTEREFKDGDMDLLSRMGFRDVYVAVKNSLATTGSKLTQLTVERVAAPPLARGAAVPAVDLVNEDPSLIELAHLTSEIGEMAKLSVQLNEAIQNRGSDVRAQCEALVSKHISFCRRREDLLRKFFPQGLPDNRTSENYIAAYAEIRKIEEAMSKANSYLTSQDPTPVRTLPPVPLAPHGHTPAAAGRRIPEPTAGRGVPRREAVTDIDAELKRVGPVTAIEERTERLRLIMTHMTTDPVELKSKMDACVNEVKEITEKVKNIDNSVTKALDKFGEEFTRASQLQLTAKFRAEVQPLQQGRKLPEPDASDVHQSRKPPSRISFN